ncbi:MAG: hypothetical protein ACP5HM_04745 [Anaerolineae bacterium]
MKKRILLIVAGLLIGSLVVTGAALAMESSNYALDWFTPLTGSGGGAANSTNYAINFTVGQAVIGASDSDSYVTCLGYWCGAAVEHSIYLPLVLRNYS